MKSDKLCLMQLIFVFLLANINFNLARISKCLRVHWSARTVKLFLFIEGFRNLKQTVYLLYNSWMLIWLKPSSQPVRLPDLQLLVRGNIQKEQTAYLQTLSKLRLPPFLLTYFWQSDDHVDLPPSPRIFDKNHNVKTKQL